MHDDAIRMNLIRMKLLIRHGADHGAHRNLVRYHRIITVPLALHPQSLLLNPPAVRLSVLVISKFECPGTGTRFNSTTFNDPSDRIFYRISGFLAGRCWRADASTWRMVAAPATSWRVAFRNATNAAQCTPTPPQRVRFFSLKISKVKIDRPDGARPESSICACGLQYLGT